MNKRFLTIISFVLVFAAAPSLHAQDAVRGSGRLSAGVSAGTIGFGVDAAFCFTPHLVFRAGYTDSFGMGVYSRTERIDSDNPWVIHGPVTATASLHTGNLSLVADVFPFRKGGFHLSLGAYCFLNPSGIARVATNEPLPIPQREWATTGIRIEHSDAPDEYVTTDPDGFLVADLRMGTQGGGIKPYVGLGFGRACGDRLLNVTFDLGVVYTGSLNV